MALTEKEKKQLDEYFNDQVSSSEDLKKYATVRDDLDKMRNFKEKGYGKSGTFDFAFVEASGSVLSLGLTGVNISATLLSKTIRGGYAGFNLIQTSIAGNGDDAKLQIGKAGFMKSLAAPFSQCEDPVAEGNDLLRHEIDVDEFIKVFELDI